MAVDWPAGPDRGRVTRMRNKVIAAVLFPCAALAQDVPLSAQAFEAFVLGKTFTYASDGAAYGAEEYLEGRRVRWSFLDGDCQEGEWYVSGDQICFVYDEIPAPQCWQFYLRSGRLLARFENDPEATELYETSQENEPLLCLGPEVGV